MQNEKTSHVACFLHLPRKGKIDLTFSLIGKESEIAKRGGVRTVEKGASSRKGGVDSNSLTKQTNQNTKARLSYHFSRQSTSLITILTEQANNNTTKRPSPSSYCPTSSA